MSYLVGRSKNLGRPMVVQFPSSWEYTPSLCPPTNQGEAGMRIQWQVEDGYVGHGYHYFEIDDEDLEGLDEKQQEKYIDECVRDEFNQTVSFVWQKE